MASTILLWFHHNSWFVYVSLITFIGYFGAHSSCNISMTLNSFILSHIVLKSTKHMKADNVKLKEKKLLLDVARSVIKKRRCLTFKKQSNLFRFVLKKIIWVKRISHAFYIHVHYIFYWKYFYLHRACLTFPFLLLKAHIKLLLLFFLNFYHNVANFFSPSRHIVDSMLILQVIFLIPLEILCFL